jgi:hypothetical protein
MAIPTLTDLRRMESDLNALEHAAARAQQRADQLRKCGGHKTINDWLAQRVAYLRGADHDGLTAILEGAMAEFTPAILEVLARRQELAAHEDMAKAVMKRAELGTFVTLEAKGGSA